MKQKIFAFVMVIGTLVLLPVRTLAAGLLVPGGQLIALELRNDTVTVAAFDEALGENARKAGLRTGDILEKIDGKAVSSAADVKAALADCGGTLQLTVLRGSRRHTVTMTPCDTAQGKKLGIYLRQGIAGVGTVSFYDPASGRFGTLGHGVSESSGHMLEMTGGQAWDARILSVKRGAAGDPGQLRGNAGGAAIGDLYRNTPQGVFGICPLPFPGEAIPTAEYEEVTAGPAKIRCTVCDGGVQEYSVEILKIYPESYSDCRNFLLHITDPALLSATGGIVQGMGVRYNRDNTGNP